MDQNIVNLAMIQVNKGRKVILGRSHYGHCKVKLKSGLFGMVTRKYSIDHDTYNEIKNRLKINSRLK